MLNSLATSPDSFLKYLLKTCSILFLALTSQLQAMNLDGKGHFGLRGLMETSPMGGQGIKKSQGVKESIFLEGELRFNDRSSFFLDLNLFDRPHYLGDTFTGRYCQNRSESSNDAQDSDCYPNTREPSYLPYTLQAEQAFVRYAFDLFIFEGGRRGRNWGMGLFLDDGARPFSKAKSLYDGLTFSINRQKSQTFGFAIGVDKVAEHGATVGSGVSAKNSIFNDHDDLEQVFLAFEYDDSLASTPGSLSKKVGIYTSRFFPSAAVDGGGSDTNVGILDLSLELQYASLLFQNEILISYGSSADPNGMYLGGARLSNGNFARNDYSSLGLAASLEWALFQSGGIIGPKNFAQGDLIRHILFTNYAYAPGNSDGYYSYRDDLSSNTDQEKKRALGITKRKNSAKAVAFHPNFRPALILFNEGNELSSRTVDGIYDPDRMMNAQIFSLGYRYENLQIGTFSTKLSYASMLEDMPSSVASYYKSAAVKQAIMSAGEFTPVGLHGKDLGFELDLEYKMRVNQDVDWGVALGALVPGKGLQTNYLNRSEYDYLLQTDLVFKF